MAVVFLTEQLSLWIKVTPLLGETLFPKQRSSSENKPLESKTMTRNEGPSYSSSTSSIDLRAKVMPLQETKGCLQQLRWLSVLLVCECLNTYVSNVNLPPPLFLSVPLPHLFPFLSYRLSRIALHEQRTSSCVYHTCKNAHPPPQRSIKQNQPPGLLFSPGRPTRFGLFVDV